MSDDAPRRLDDFIGYHLRRASVLDMNGAAKALEATGLRVIHMSVLLTIAESPAISSAEICRILGMQRANIVGVLGDLEKLGLVDRTPDSFDNRVQRLTLSAKGEAMAAQTLAAMQAHEEELLARLSRDQRSQLRQLLAVIWAERQESVDKAGE